MASRIVRWVAFSCVHAPLQHEPSIKRLLKEIANHRPHVVVCLGDLLDASPASRFPTEDQWGLLEEYEQAGRILERVREAASGDAERFVWLHGNHDQNILEPCRLPKRLRSLCDWHASDNRLSRELQAGGWKEVGYSHRQVWRLGQVAFQHGAEHGVNAGRNLAQLYAPEFGLLVWGHTHRPTPASEAFLVSKVSLNRWHANAGCLVDWNRLAYVQRMNTSLWGHACVVGEALSGGRRIRFGARNWDAETVVFDRCG